MSKVLAGLALLLLAGTAPAQQQLGTAPYPNWNPQPTPVAVYSQPRPLPAAIEAPVLPRSGSMPVDPIPQAYLGVERAMLQQPATGYRPEDIPELINSLNPPGSEKLYGRVNSEAELFESWRQEAQLSRSRISFPEEPVLSREPYLGRVWPERALLVEPNYVNYERLYFEELNSERYGWDLGFFGVAYSAGCFYKDLALLPYHMMTDPLRKFDSSAGYCLPGAPVPFRIYPEGLSATGAFGEAAAIVALLAIFP